MALAGIHAGTSSRCVSGMQVSFFFFDCTLQMEPSESSITEHRGGHEKLIRVCGKRTRTNAQARSRSAGAAQDQAPSRWRGARLGRDLQPCKRRTA